MVFAVEAMPTEERVILALSLVREVNVKINEYALSELWGIIRVRLIFSVKNLSHGPNSEKKGKREADILLYKKSAGGRARKRNSSSFLLAEKIDNHSDALVVTIT